MEDYAICLVKIKKTVSEAIHTLIPYLPLDKINRDLFENSLKVAYIRSRKLYRGNY